jgi:hypothetical protein
MTAPAKTISPEHVQSAIDAVLGIDPSQAPIDPVELNERLSIPQPGVTEALTFVFSHSSTKNVHRAAPQVYVALEAANLAFPEEMKVELKSKAFVTAMTGVTTESLAAAKGTGQVESALKERQPALVSFVEQQFARDGSFAKKLSIDDRAGVYALALGAIRAVDKHLLGPEKPATASKEPGRNEPCHCGSGKKYKKCHGNDTRTGTDDRDLPETA